MQLLIRTAKASDLPILLDIMNFMIAHTNAIYESNPRTIEYIENWWFQKNENEYPVFVAEVDGEVVGYATYGPFRPFEGFRFTIEHSIYITDTFQGKGIGKKLLQYLITYARSAGYVAMIAGIDGANKGSIYLHQREGFTEVGRLPRTGFKNGQWLDLVFLELLLQESSSS